MTSAAAASRADGAGDRGVELEPFLVLTAAPHGRITVAVDSARAARAAARHLVERYPRSWATWAPSPRLTGPVVVFGAARSPSGEPPGDQPVHVFLLTPGQTAGPEWVARCGQRLHDTDLIVLDHGVGALCPACLRHWITHFDNPDHYWMVPPPPQCRLSRFHFVITTETGAR